jgi:voltage-gated potassium channel
MADPDPADAATSPPTPEEAATHADGPHRTGHVPLRDRPPSQRELLAERIAAQLDIPVTVAGILFLLVVVADGLTPASAEWRWVWDVASWAFWSLFVLEFVVRLVVAPSTLAFLRRNWWQVVFLVLPFLRFLRAFTRSARVGRALTTSVRGTRTAGRTLGSRVAYLGAATVGVVLGGSQILYEFGPGITYAEALHDVAFATISGEPFGLEGAVASTLELVLALYATILFATLAGSLGAFFLERTGERKTGPDRSGEAVAVGSAFPLER